MKRLERLKVEGHKNKKMNDNTYALRRRVLSIIYEANKIVGKKLPRVDVRITTTEDKDNWGMARCNDNILWIPEHTLNKSEKLLRHVVYHELVHAIFGIRHIEKCKLMTPFVNEKSACTKSECHRLFLKYFKEAKNECSQALSMLVA